MLNLFKLVYGRVTCTAVKKVSEIMFAKSEHKWNKWDNEMYPEQKVQSKESFKKHFTVTDFEKNENNILNHLAPGFGL